MAAPAITPFAAVAHVLLPADPDRRGVVVDADRDPGLTGACLPAEADVVVWGRLAGAYGPPLRRAAARELALRRLRGVLPERLHVDAVHRLPAERRGAGPRARARAALRAGVLVEIGSGRGGPRVLDAVARAAGATDLGPIRAGTGGTMLVQARLRDGSRAVLRVARAGAPGDPAPLADTLERLAAAAVAPVPRPRGRGLVAGASWTAEEAMAGRRPARLTARLLGQVAAACARLPRSDGPPTAPVDDLLGAASRLPERAAQLRWLAESLGPVLRSLPAVHRHGDLWTGNLLVDGGRLAGIVDWDAAHPAGAPGADLVQLLGSDARRRGHRSLGAAVLDPGWRSSVLAAPAAAYWRAVGVAPVRDALDAAGLAWWATEIHHTLLRLPHRAADERWVAANVDPVLAAFVP